MSQKVSDLPLLLLYPDRVLSIYIQRPLSGALPGQKKKKKGSLWETEQPQSY